MEVGNDHAHRIEPALLKSFAVFQTADPEEFKHALFCKFGAMGVSVETGVGFETRASILQLQDIGFVLGASNAGVSIDFPETDSIRFMIALAGGGSVTMGSHAVELSEQLSCIVSPGQSEQCSVKGDHSWLTLRIDPNAIERKLISLLGEKPKGKLEFVATANRRHPRVQSLIQLILYFAEHLDSKFAELPPLLVRELEQAIMVSFLCANQNTFSERLGRDAREIAPHQVRRAEEYIEANWNSPISLEKLVAVTGASERSLFRSFVKTHGYTPMSFARLVRLRHAKQLLSAGNPETSVTGVAFQCGFASLGRFANNYRKLFGELPSDTLARTRRINSK